MPTILRRLVAGLAAAAALLLGFAPTIPASAAAPARATGTFVAGSGNYLLVPGGTDGLSQLGGHVTFSQAGNGATIHVHGRVTGLPANSAFVAVPYKDGACLPVVGVTAFPSGAFTTNARGVAVIPAGVTVNPRAINPAGTVNVPDTHSVSVRQVVFASRPVPPVPGYPNGLPAGTPTIPNGAAVEGCDRTPTR